MAFGTRVFQKRRSRHELAVCCICCYCAMSFPRKKVYNICIHNISPNSNTFTYTDEAKTAFRSCRSEALQKANRDQSICRLSSARPISAWLGESIFRANRLPRLTIQLRLHHLPTTLRTLATSFARLHPICVAKRRAWLERHALTGGAVRHSREKWKESCQIARLVSP